MIIVRGARRVYSHSAQLRDRVTQRRNQADSRDRRAAPAKAHASFIRRIHISSREQPAICPARSAATKPDANANGACNAREAPLASSRTGAQQSPGMKS
jgi:hypothetical protein